MDISDKQEKLKKFIWSSQEFLEQIPQIVFLKNIDFTFAGVNSQVLNFTRLRHKKRILGKEDYGLPWADGADIYREIDKAVLTGANKKTVVEIRVASGEKMTVIQNKNLVRDIVTKEPIGIIAAMTELDISLLKHFSDIKSQDNRILAQAGINLLNYRIEEYGRYSLTTRESECLFLLLRGLTIKK